MTMNRMLHAAIGFAAAESGSGVAYVRCGRSENAPVLRVPFGVRRLRGLQGREVAYAALTAVAAALYDRGVERIHIQIDDEALCRDLNERRDVPSALTIAYVRVRCALNRFALADVAPLAGPSDLTARAVGEVTLHIAA